MEKIKLVRANLQELAEALKQLLTDKSFTFTRTKTRVYEDDDS